MGKVVFTKDFNKCLRDLRKGGKKGKDAATKALAAQAEAGNDGEIRVVPRTHHGEARADVEKYDLGDGYRLIVQLVDSKQGTRAFLFAGTHDEADVWLKTHKNYQWVKRDTDGTLDFVQISVPTPMAASISLPDLDSPPSLLDLPLLRDLSDREWALLKLPAQAGEYARNVTAADWESDGNGVIQHLEQLADDERALLMLDLFHHAHQREWNALHRRIEMEKGAAHAAQGAEAAAAMVNPVNSEKFITWDDSKVLPPDKDWADWMLFLHPEQKKLVKLDLNGAARLRGVSGSGKTCVMVHRARYLAKKYGEKVFVVTLTESMRKLLDNLLNALCGAERGLILTYTMNSLAKDIIKHFHSRGEAWYTMATEQRLYGMEKEAIRIVSEHADFQKTLLGKLEGQKLARFVIDEINYVRSRLPVKEYETYPTKSFKRTGRSQSLGEVGRRICLEAIRYWDQELNKSHTLDYQGIVQAAWDLVTLPDNQKNKAGGFVPRCILVDEVQDLSQLEVRLLGQLRTHGEPIGTVENGLFLVGDGAQTIYKRGFSLSSIGVSVSGRSWVLKKNYRNSLEILKAAYSLIDDYEFADIDEDSIQKPLEPDYATRHGDRPFIVKCRSLADEATFVTSQIQALIGEEVPPGQICVVGPNPAVREAVSKALIQAKLRWTELREDADFDNNRIKISTIESSKGHEFRAVFIAGLVDGVLPFHDAPSEDLPRVAARLYVAMTRARDNLHLSYTSNANFRPSPLLASVQKYCNEMRWHDHRLQPITDPMDEG